jgi:hypothetical protein
LKINFKPRNNQKISLFAHWGEALVFWISISGLVLLAIITIVRAIDRSNTRKSFQELRNEQQQVYQKIELLEKQNETFIKQNDSLWIIIHQLKSDPYSTSQKRLYPIQPSQTKPKTEQERNRQKFLRASQGK